MRPIIAGSLVAAGLWAACCAARAGQPDDDYAVAANHYAQQRWKLAAEAFQAFLQDHPQHSQAGPAVYLLGESLLQTGRTKEAEGLFRRYLERQPQGPYARGASFRAGEAAYLLGEHQRAKPELERFLAAHPDDDLNAFVLPYLGEIVLAAGDAAAAERSFRDALKRFPQGQLQDQCRLGIGRALAKQGQNEEAERMFVALAGKTGSPLAEDAQFQLGNLQFAMGRHAQAAEAFAAFEAKFAQSPRRAEAQLARGAALMKLDQLAEARTLFESLAADAKLGPEARYWLGLTQKGQQQWAAAAKTLAELADAEPKHARAVAARYHAGEAMLRAGQAAGARQQFGLALAADEGGEWGDRAWRGKIQAALDLKDHATADREAADFLARRPQSALRSDVVRLLAGSLLERQRFDEAAKLLAPLVPANRPEAAAPEDRYLLAVAYEGQQRYEEALTALLPALPAAKGKLKADALLRQGALLAALRRHAEAVAPLEACLAEPPGDDGAVKARGELAVCYARTGRLDKAKQTFNELVQKHPKHELLAAAVEQLAEAAYEAKDAAWAGELFARLEQAGAAGDQTLRGLSGLGWSQLKANRLEEAAATFALLLKRNPPAALEAEAALARGQVLDQLGQSDAALAMYDLVVDRHGRSPQHPQALFAAARLRDKLQQDREAAALFEKLATNYPQFEKLDAAIYDWAWVLQELNKPQEADQLFERLRKDFARSRYAQDAAYRLAQRAAAAKDYARAKPLLAEALAADGDPRLREHVRHLQGQIAAAQEDWAEVQRAFEAAVKESPQSAHRLTAEFWIAEAHYRRGEFEAAGKLLDALAARLPDRRDAWMGMVPLRQAQVLAQQKKWKEAQAIVAKIEKDYPDFEQQYEADYLLGRCLHADSKLTEAREAFQRVIRSAAGAKTETAAMAQWMIGETYFHQKNYEAALREYLRLEILYAFPTWQAAGLLQAGKCHDLLGEKKEAAALYARIVKVYPSTPFAEQAGQLLRSAASPVPPP